MAFPTETNKRPLAFVLAEAQSLALRLKGEAAQISERSLAGNLTALDVLVYQERVKASLSRLEILRTAPGVGQFAKDQFADQLFDIAIEFDAMLLEMQNVLTWIRVNIPTSAGGFVEAQTIELDDTVIKRTFSSAQTVTFRVQLDALIASIA